MEKSQPYKKSGLLFEIFHNSHKVRISLLQNRTSVAWQQYQTLRIVYLFACLLSLKPVQLVFFQFKIHPFYRRTDCKEELRKREEF